MGKLDGKVVLVTGASRGIGKAIALLFASEGAKVACVARSVNDGDHKFLEGSLAATVREVHAAGGTALAIKADLSREEECVQAVATAKEVLGPIDVLINDAALSYFSPIKDTPTYRWDASWSVSVRAVFLLCKQVLPDMIQNGAGAIVNVPSGSAIGPGRGPYEDSTAEHHITIYGAIKGALERFTQGLAEEIRDARQIWGTNTRKAEESIKRELHDEDVQTALIGQAGENLVGFASITVGGHRAAGRTGGGCVMGSKNLKGLVARGRKGIEVANVGEFIAAMDEVHSRFVRASSMVGAWRQSGTLFAIDHYQHIHSNAYRNGQIGAMPSEAAAKINYSAYMNTLFDHCVACSPGCATACSAWQRVKGFESVAAKHFVGERGLKPEYLAVASLGIGTDIPDLAAICHLNDLCFEYGVDLVEMGNAVSFLMECIEKEVFSNSDLTRWMGEESGLAWGSWEAAARVIESVGSQSNDLGRLFKDNVYHAAKHIEDITGNAALKYVNYGKGGATFSEDPRPFPGCAVNMAVASRGTDHLKGQAPHEKGGRKDTSTAWFGRPDAGITHGTSLKGALSARAENINCATNACGVCAFMGARDGDNFGHDLLSIGLRALTGLHFDKDSMYNIGERICNIEKAFNSRLGRRRADDSLCDRWMNVPTPGGPGQGMKAADYLERLLDEYYEYKGWDKETGLQRRDKLSALGLDDVADVLAAEHALVD